MTTVAPPVSDEELLARYLAGDESALAVAAELDAADTSRRDRAARARAGQRARHEGWETAARANFEAAERYCRGDDNMLNPRGKAAGISPWDLWHGSEERARLYASDDLIRFWDYHAKRPPGPNDYATAEREAAAEQRIRADTPSPGMLAAIAAARGEPKRDDAPPVAAPAEPGTFVKFNAALDWMTRKAETSAARIAAANGRS